MKLQVRSHDGKRMSGDVAGEVADSIALMHLLANHLQTATAAKKKSRKAQVEDP